MTLTVRILIGMAAGILVGHAGLDLGGIMRGGVEHGAQEPMPVGNLLIWPFKGLVLLLLLLLLLSGYRPGRCKKLIL